MSDITNLAIGTLPSTGSNTAPPVSAQTIIIGLALAAIVLIILYLFVKLKRRKAQKEEQVQLTKEDNVNMKYPDLYEASTQLNRQQASHTGAIIDLNNEKAQLETRLIEVEKLTAKHQKKLSEINRAIIELGKVYNMVSYIDNSIDHIEKKEKSDGIQQWKCDLCGIVLYTNPDEHANLIEGAYVKCNGHFNKIKEVHEAMEATTSRLEPLPREEVLPQPEPKYTKVENPAGIAIISDELNSNNMVRQPTENKNPIDIIESKEHHFVGQTGTPSTEQNTTNIQPEGKKITPAMVPVVDFIKEHPNVFHKDIAAALNIHKGNLSKTLKALVDMGVVKHNEETGYSIL